MPSRAACSACRRSRSTTSCSGASTPCRCSAPTCRATPGSTRPGTARCKLPPCPCAPPGADPLDSPHGETPVAGFTLVRQSRFSFAQGSVGLAQGGGQCPLQECGHVPLFTG